MPSTTIKVNLYALSYIGDHVLEFIFIPTHTTTLTDAEITANNSKEVNVGILFLKNWDWKVSTNSDGSVLIMFKPGALI